MTSLLKQWELGDTQAGARLVALAYRDLRRLAARELRHEWSDCSLQVTELVHEIYLRLATQTHPRWQNREHFFAITTRLVRRVLVDHARKKRSLKRTPPAPSSEHGSVLAALDVNLDLLGLDRVLDDLARLDELAAKIVELRYFGGLSVSETAATLGVGRATVGRRWRSARAWLREALIEGVALDDRRSHDQALK